LHDSHSAAYMPSAEVYMSEASCKTPGGVVSYASIAPSPHGHISHKGEQGHCCSKLNLLIYMTAQAPQPSHAHACIIPWRLQALLYDEQASVTQHGSDPGDSGAPRRAHDTTNAWVAGTQRCSAAAGIALHIPGHVGGAGQARGRHGARWRDIACCLGRPWHAVQWLDGALCTEA
jgi:hypothetical protein